MSRAGIGHPMNDELLMSPRDINGDAIGPATSAVVICQTHAAGSLACQIGIAKRRYKTISVGTQHNVTEPIGLQRHRLTPLR